LRYGSVDGEVWPNFFIVGAAKAGTTSLYRYLAQHPNIYMPKVKEPHWFSRVKNPGDAGRITTEADYLRLFQGWRGEKAVGEASPSYLWESKAPYRIKERLPEAKIIILLRNPVDRAFSHYLMDVRDCIQQRPFYEAIMTDYGSQPKRWGISHLYVELGEYHEQMLRYLDCFGRERVLTLFFEEVFSGPRATSEAVAQITDFLGVDPCGSGSIHVHTKHNPYVVTRSRAARFLVKHPRWRTVGGRLLSERGKQFFNRRVLFRETEKPSSEPEALDFLRGVYKVEMEPLKKILRRELTWSF
jgi:hypothetical protein